MVSRETLSDSPELGISADATRELRWNRLANQLICPVISEDGDAPVPLDFDERCYTACNFVRNGYLKHIERVASSLVQTTLYQF